MGHSGDEEAHHSFQEQFEHPGKTWASVTHRQFSLQAVAVATVNATYRWVESEARRILREVLKNVREKERRQEVTRDTSSRMHQADAERSERRRRGR